jgi:NhaA family Na+:H+ antiporter
MISTSCKAFTRWHALAGVLAILAAVLGLIAVATNLAPWYALVREPVLTVSLGALSLGRPLAAWINQMLMTGILFLTGLECKRAFVDGELSGPERLRLPLAAALGGMTVSAAIHFAFGGGDPNQQTAWVATLGMDMALGLAALSWLGDRVPGALKVFFATAAMFSVLAGAVLMAVVLAPPFSWPAMAVAGLCLGLLACMNRGGVRSVSLYLFPAVVAWVVLADCAVHAALVGPLLACCIPAQGRDGTGSVLHGLERDLLPLVCLISYPVLVFVNIGALSGEEPWDASAGIWFMQAALGLFPGKALGVFGVIWALVRLRICALPAGVGWKEMGATATLCGAGMVPGLYALALVPGPGTAQLEAARAGIVAGSFVSMALGFFLLRQALSRRRNKVMQRL